MAETFLTPDQQETLLSIEDLFVEYHTDDGIIQAVNGISLHLRKGESLGIVGETGAGKTTTAMSILRLLPPQVGKQVGGRICYCGVVLDDAAESTMRQIRGNKISMIFQDPMTSLNPSMRIGAQIAEVIQVHNEHLNKEQVQEQVDKILSLVGILPARKNDFPHQFSGGMKQRVVIAIALACQPDLLIADEPTTALDVTIQAQVLNMIEDLKSQLGTSLILISHDLGVIARMCDTVAIMYAGEIIEYGTAQDIYEGSVHHPYTDGLFGSIPDLTKNHARLTPIDGLMPDPSDLPAGCKFHPRCQYCTEICRETAPPDHHINGTHFIKCHRCAGGER